MATAAKMISKTKGTDETKKEDTSKKSTPTKSKAPAKKTTAAKADVLVQVSQEVETLTKVKALKQALELVEQQDFNAFKLGGILAAIQLNEYWQGEKDPDGEIYATLKDFMAGEYGMNYRKGMYLIGIYNSLIEAEVAWDQVKDIGWTKLKELHSVLTKENVEEWVEKAMSMTTIQLIDYIKNLEEGDGESGEKEKSDESGKLTTITFKVHEDQKDTIQSAIDKAMKDNKTDVSSVALDYICMAFLEGKAGKAKKVKLPTLKELMVKEGDEKTFGALEEAYPQYDITVTPVEDGEGGEDGAGEDE